MDREEIIKKILDIDYRTKRLNIVNALGVAGPMEISILKFVCDNNGVGVSKIAEELRASAPNISRALRLLEKDGKIRREIDAGDRRNTLVYITETGREYVHKNVCIMIGFFVDTLKRLSDEELDMYLKLSNKLYDVYIEELNKRKEN